MKISVLICTRNRADSLAQTLASVLGQTSGAPTFELLVIDNGSTDATRAVVEQAQASHAQKQQPTALIAVRYVYEPRPGLSIARNTGIRASHGEILAFTDDDVLVAPNWLAEIAREFAADAQLTMLGGRILLARPELQPVTIKTSEVRQVFRERGDYNALFGANMAFRRRVFTEIGLFDARLGAGCFLAGGDEADLLFRGLRAGHHVLYAPNVLAWHDHGRSTVAQAVRLDYGYGKGQTGLLMKHLLAGDGYAARVLYWSLRGLPRRWWTGVGETEALRQRSRAHCNGILAALPLAPLLLWFQAGETEPLRAEEPPNAHDPARAAEHLA